MMNACVSPTISRAVICGPPASVVLSRQTPRAWRCRDGPHLNKQSIKEVIEMITKHSSSQPTNGTSPTSPTRALIASADDEFRAELRRSCLAEGRAEIDAIKNAFQAFYKSTGDAAL